MKEQIEEMAKDLQETHDYEGCEAWHCGGCGYEKYGKGYFCSSIKQAEKMTEKGYRKQKEGEWIVVYEYNDYRMCKEAKIACSICGHKPKYDGYLSDMNFCPNCGSKMNGGE